MNFRPMLAASLDGVDLSTLRYPLLISPKLDGVRCIVWDGVAYSRNAKPIRNFFVQEWAADKHNLDGELIVGSSTEGEVLGRTQSGVMSYEGQPDFTFWVFDCPDRRYKGRHADELVLPFHRNFNDRLMRMSKLGRVWPVHHHMVESPEALLAIEQGYLESGYEGVMLRAPDGPYKNGRSTLKEGYLMKLKRFMDGEAVVIGLEEAMENTNEAKLDELGRTKRSRTKDGVVGKGMVGAIIVKDKRWGELRLSPGIMTHQERKTWWDKHLPGVSYDGGLVGKIVHWRSFGYGVKDKPRFPRFYGIREDL